MRRTVFSLLSGALLFVCAGAAEAQTIGFKLGASLSNFSTSGDGDEAYDRKTGFVGGGFARFGMGRIGIQPEILSVSKGAQISDVVGDDDASISLEYIEIPVLIHLPLSMGTSFSPYVVAGPAVAFEIGCSTEFGDDEADCDDDEDSTDREKTDFGLTAGAGLGFAMGPGAIIIEARYTWGLTNLNGDANDSFEIKNRAGYITAGYEVPLGRR